MSNEAVHLTVQRQSRQEPDAIRSRRQLNWILGKLVAVKFDWLIPEAEAFELALAACRDPMDAAAAPGVFMA